MQRFLGLVLGAGDGQRGPARNNDFHGQRRPSRRMTMAPPAPAPGFAPRRRSIGLANYISSRRSAPAAQPPPRPDDAIFFKEGRGYLLVRHLESGADGTASLVRSVCDGKLYVRKEDLGTQTFPNRSFRVHSDAPLEIANARAVREVPGVYEAHGWTRWIQRDRPRYFDVTYWRYYNLGSLKSYNNAARRSGRYIPEEWCTTWFVKMIDILATIHERGFVHQDCHGGNWFLETSTSGIPHIVLGDFGRSERQRPHADFHASARWTDRCKEDFILLLAALTPCLGLIYDEPNATVHTQKGYRCSNQLLALLRDLAQVAGDHHSSVTSLHRRVWSVYDEAQDLQGQYGYFQGFAATRQVTPLEPPRYLAGMDNIQSVVVSRPQAYKQWRFARVLGNNVTTVANTTLGPVGPITGHFYTHFVEGRNAYVVDGH